MFGGLKKAVKKVGGIHKKALGLGVSVLSGGLLGKAKGTLTAGASKAVAKTRGSSKVRDYVKSVRTRRKVK